MARMIPSRCDADAAQSERTVYEALADQLPGAWLVLHSKRLFLPADERHRTPYEGEADFVVIDPRRGVLVLEVKGGQAVWRDEDGIWYSKSYGGRVHETSDPGRQAQRMAHRLSDYLTARGLSCSFGWGVILPGVDVRENLGPELSDRLVIDKPGLRELPSRLDAVFAAHGMTEPSDYTLDLERYARHLVPRCSLVPTLGASIADDETVFLRLTDEQQAILDTLDEVKRVAVKGGAGTGKTLVATERARRLAEAERAVLLLCFNKPLADHLEGTAGDARVDNFHGFCRSIALEAGLPFEPPKRDDGEFWEIEAPALLDEALDVLPGARWDDVIVDEGQDFKELWWDTIQKTLRDDDDSSLWVFWDPNQNIYGGGPVDSLGLTPATLKWNCRNTTRIAEHCADLVGYDVSVKPGAPEGTNVRLHDYENDREMVEATRKFLHYLVHDEGLDAEQIVILSAGALEKSPVWNRRRLGNFELVLPDEREEANQVRMSTLHRFKGLEADAVILCDVVPGSPYQTPQHLYVGASRAKHVLYVLRAVEGIGQ